MSNVEKADFQKIYDENITVADIKSDINTKIANDSDGIVYMGWSDSNLRSLIASSDSDTTRARTSGVYMTESDGIEDLPKQTAS